MIKDFPTFCFRPDVPFGPVLRRNVLHLRYRGDVVRGPRPGGQDRSDDICVPKVGGKRVGIIKKKHFFFKTELMFKLVVIHIELERICGKF